MEPAAILLHQYNSEQNILDLVDDESSPVTSDPEKYQSS